MNGISTIYKSMRPLLVLMQNAKQKLMIKNKKKTKKK